MTLSHYRGIGRPATPEPLGRRLRSRAAPWLRGRRGLILGGAVLLAGGLALGWGWLAALGIAPVIVALAPCLAMCGLGACMMMMGNSSGSASVAVDAAAVVEAPEPEPGAASPPRLLTRRMAIILGGLVIAAGGLALGWGWLAAVGIAPVILALLPCAAMCALGLCMMPRGKASCGTTSAAAPKSAANSTPDSSTAPEV